MGWGGRRAACDGLVRTGEAGSDQDSVFTMTHRVTLAASRLLGSLR